MEVRDLLKILRRRHRLAIVMFLLALGGQYLGLQTRQPTFSSSGEYMLKSVPERLPEAIRPQDVLGGDRGPVQVVLDLSDRTDVPEVLVSSDEVLALAADIVHARYPGREITAAEIGAGLSVTPVANRGTYTISWRSADRDLPPVVIRALAQAYQRMAIRRLQSGYNELLGRLGRWADEAGTRRREAQEALSGLQERTFAEQNIVVPDLQVAEMLGQISELEHERSEAHLQILQATHREEELRRSEELEWARRHAIIPGVVPMPRRQPPPESLMEDLRTARNRLLQLTRAYTEEHPQVVLVREEIEGIRAQVGDAMKQSAAENVLAIEEEIDLHRSTEEFLQQVIRTEYARLRDMTEVRDQFTRLRDEEQRAAEEEAQYRDRSRQLDLQRPEVEETEEGTPVLSQEIRAPVPGSQAPLEGRTIVMIFAVAIVVAGAFTMFAEYVADRLRSVADIKAHMGIPTIDVIPDLRGKPALLLQQAAGSPLLEVYNKLATLTEEALHGKGKRTLLITSTTQGEGKTTVATNVAVALAQSGRRVILIDGDLRRGQVHASLGLESAKGLGSYLLASEGSIDDVMQAGPVEGLRVVVCGPKPRNPVMALKSERFHRLLEELEARKDVDVVIVDSPPLLGVIDPVLIAGRGVPVLLIVRENAVRRAEAGQAKSALTRVKAEVLGAVLNASREEPESYYYYYYYRYKGY